MGYPDDGWTVGAAVNFSANTVISGAVSDWPSLVVGSAIHDDVWAALQASGADLRFSSDEAGEVPLFYDPVRLDVASKDAHMYVKMDHAADAGATAYAWAGNAEAAAPTTAEKQAAYAADIAAWWPMEEGEGTTVGDRTTNGADGTIVGGAWHTIVDGRHGLEFTGEDRIEIPNGPVDAMVDAGTCLCAWRHDGTGDEPSVFFDSRAGGYAGWDVLITAERGYGDIAVILDEGENWEEIRAQTSIVGLDAAMHTVAGAWDGATLRLYLDGDMAGDVACNVPIGRSADPPKLGNQVNNAAPLGASRYMVSVALMSRGATADEMAVAALMLTDPTWATAGDVVELGSGNVFVPPIGVRGGAHDAGPRVHGGAGDAGPQIIGGARRMDPHVR